MMNNIFNPKSALYPYKSMIILVILLIVFMLYHDLNGGRMFASGKQELWNRSGPAYHK